MKQRYESNKKGFSILSFILGILLGIILVVGGIVGGVFVVLNTNVDTVLGWFGQDNSKDENGRNKIINTDEATGVKNLMELIDRIIGENGLLNKGTDLTLGDIDALIPATTGLVQSLVDMVADYVTIDVEELKTVKISEFADYAMEVVETIEIGRVLDITIEGGGTNRVVDVLINGTEADTVTIDGTIFPVYFDRYYSTSSGYKRRDSQNNYVGASLLSKYVPYLSGGGDGEAYTLYFYKAADGTPYVLEKGANARASVKNGYIVTQVNYSDSYNETYEQCTGNYYILNGERQYFNPVTVGTFMNSSGFGPLEKIELLDLISSEDELLEVLLDGITLGDIMNGSVSFQSKLDEIKLSAFFDVAPDDSVMVYLAYGVTSVRFENGEWLGMYTPDGSDPLTCHFETTTKDSKVIISRAYYTDNGKEIELGTTLASVSSIIDGVSIDIFLDIEASNSILVYLGYGLTDVNYNEQSHTGTGILKTTVNGNPVQYNCVIEASDRNIVTRVYYVDNGATVIVAATGLDEINDRVSGITENLKIRDVIDINPDDRIMSKLGEYEISRVGEAIDTFVLGDFIDISADNALMVYLGYGVTGVKEDNGVWTASLKISVGEFRTVTLDVNAEGIVTAVYYEENGKTVYVDGTSINAMNGRIDGIMNDLTVGELIEIDESNTVMNAVKNSTINSIAVDIDKITVNDLYAFDVYENSEIIAADEYNADYLYYTWTNGKYELVEDGGVYEKVNGEYKAVLGKVTQSYFNAHSDELYTRGKVTALWKLILFTPVYDGEGGDSYQSEKSYTLNDLSKMISNVTSNIRNATLNDLVEAGVLEISSDALGKDMPSYSGHSGKKFGQLTLSEAIDYIVSTIDV